MRDTENTRLNVLTDKQKAMLEFIRDFIERNHYSPTFGEIRVGMGLSTNSLVDYHLRQLEAAGCITRKRYTPRTILVINS